MKKIIASILLASLCVTPALADPYRGHYEHREHHDHDGVSTGGAVAIGIGALLLGAIIADSNRTRPREDRYERQYVPQTFCQNEYARDQYGNLVYDYYGRVQIVQRCWQQ